MKIQHIFTPASTDIDFLTQKIDQEIADLGTSQPFAFFIRDEKDNIIAGCNGIVFFGCIYTDQLWVDKEYRMQGLGKQLIDNVHEYGKKSGCRMATLATMSFQKAQGFYKKLGYVVDFERHGYIQDSSCYFLRKML